MFYCWVLPVRQGVLLKLLADTECHLTLFARYAKDEIPDEIDGDDNTLTTSLHRYLTARRQMWRKPAA